MGSGEPSVKGFISKAFSENFLPTQRPVNRSAASVDGHMVGSNPSVNGLFEALIFQRSAGGPAAEGRERGRRSAASEDRYSPAAPAFNPSSL
jgi:hypothetical protein